MSFERPRRAVRLTLPAVVAGVALVWSGDVEAHIEPLGVHGSAWAAMPEMLEVSLPERLGEGLATRFSEADEPHANEDGALCTLLLDGEPRLTLGDDPLWREPPEADVVAAWHTDKHGALV